MKVKNIKNSYFVKDFKIDENSINKEIILGTNAGIRSIYEKGTLDTLMITGVEPDLGVTKSLGGACGCPDKLIKLFQLISKVYGNLEEENLAYLGISSYENDKVLLTSHCNDSCDEMYMLFFDVVGEKLIMSEGSRSLVDESYISKIEEGVRGVINWCSGVFPIPLYSIEYYSITDRKTTSSIGRRNFYVGFSSATAENGVSGILTEQDNKPKEYSLIFLEE